MIDPAPLPIAPQSSERRRRRNMRICIILVLLLTGGSTLFYQHLRRERLWIRLLQTNTEAILNDPALTAFALAQAKPLYVKHCAQCHGADMRGSYPLGAPNLIDRYWLYGVGSVFDIERTLLYGIRSGHGKSHDVTDMPAFGLTGRLSTAQIQDLVQYLLQLSGRPRQAMAASEGRAIYESANANCGDCHAEDGRGNSNYGAPDLTANVWNSGGEPQALYDAIYYGQHHIMPAWIEVLSLQQIRALAVFIYANSHHD
jgi:cytochrome c oxidase cbb3-type subunit III